MKLAYALKKKNIQFYIDMMLEAGRKGWPLEVFLNDLYIRKSEWDEYSRKHEEIRVAMADAKATSKGVVLDRITDMIYEKRINQNLAKMYIENMTGWGLNVAEPLIDEPFNVEIRVRKKVE